MASSRLRAYAEYPIRNRVAGEIGRIAHKECRYEVHGRHVILDNGCPPVVPRALPKVTILSIEGRHERSALVMQLCGMAVVRVDEVAESRSVTARVAWEGSHVEGEEHLETSARVSSSIILVKSQKSDHTRNEQY
jgi:hypothetical protein